MQFEGLHRPIPEKNNFKVRQKKHAHDSPLTSSWQPVLIDGRSTPRSNPTQQWQNKQKESINHTPNDKKN
jgi:hypothetical protein